MWGFLTVRATAVATRFANPLAMRMATCVAVHEREISIGRRPSAPDLRTACRLAPVEVDLRSDRPPVVAADDEGVADDLLGAAAIPVLDEGAGRRELHFDLGLPARVAWFTADGSFQACFAPASSTSTRAQGRHLPGTETTERSFI